MPELPSLLGVLFLVSACARPAPAPPTIEGGNTLETAELGSLQRVHRAGDVWLASQPSAADFELLKGLGIKTVVDLRHPGELTAFDERATVEGLGLAYLSLPFQGASEMSDPVLDRARELLRTAERPLLFHCASANRVGAVWLPYRVLDEHQGFEGARAEAREIGLRSPELEARAIAYVVERRER
jgi:protein tyrosine phosphatase (PTP) superfamily phosphohydrolase (DUF442 family)